MLKNVALLAQPSRSKCRIECPRITTGRSRSSVAMHYAKMSPVPSVRLSACPSGSILLPCSSDSDANSHSYSDSDADSPDGGGAMSWPVVGCRCGIKLRLMLSELMARGKLNGSSFILLELRQSIDAVAGFVTVAGSFPLSRPPSSQLPSFRRQDKVYKCLAIGTTKESRPGNFHYQLAHSSGRA